MQEAWRAYLDLALGFTEASRKRATKVAKKLMGRGGATAEQLQSMAEELVNTSTANRESLVRLVRFELDRTLGRVGLATAEEVSQLTKRVRELEEELRLARTDSGPAVLPAADDELAASAVPAAPAASSPATVVKKVVAKKAVAKKAVAGANAAAAPVKATTAKTATPAKTAAPAKATAPAKVTAPAKAAPAKATTTAPAKTTPAKAAPSKAVAKKTAARTPASMPTKKTTGPKLGDGGNTGTQP